MVTLSQFSCFITPLKPFLFAGFCPIASVSILKIEVNFNREYIYIYFQNAQFYPHRYRMVLLMVAAHWKVTSESSVVRRGTLLLVRTY